MGLQNLTAMLGYEYNPRGIRAAIKDMEKMVSAEGRWEKAQGRSAKAGQGWMRGLKAQAGAITALGAATGLSLGLATRRAGEFNKAMREVMTLLPEGEQDFEGMSAQVLELSKVMGIDAVESARSLYQAISAGVPPDNAIEFLAIASKAAVGGATTLEVAVDGLTTATNAWASAGLSASRAADVMFAGVVTGKTTFEELSASMFQVAPLAATMNVSIEEVVAAVASLTKQGTPTTVAMTQVRAAMVAMQKESEGMTQAYQHLGVAGFEELIEKGGGLQGAFVLLRQAADELGVPMTALTGRVEGALGILAVTGDNAAQAAADLDFVAGSAGMAAKAFQTMAEDPTFALAQFREQVKGASIEIGRAMLPMLADLAGAFGPVVGMIADADPVVKALIGTFAAAPAVLGPVAMVLPKLAEGFLAASGGATGLKGAMAALSAAGPVLVLSAMVAAIVAVKTAFRELDNTMEEAAQALAKTKVEAREGTASLQEYQDVTAKAREEAGGLGGILASLTDSLGRVGSVTGESWLATAKAGEEWLTYSTSADQAVVKSQAVQRAIRKLAIEVKDGRMTTAEMERQLLDVANAEARASGFSVVLTGAQQEQAAAFKRSTEALMRRNGVNVEAVRGEERYAEILQSRAELVASGAMTHAQARQEIEAMTAALIDETAAQEEQAKAAEVALGLLEPYSEALASFTGGVGFGAALSDEELEAFGKQRAKAEGAIREHFSAMLASRQQYESDLAAAQAEGDADRIAQVQQDFATEEAAQKEHLAKLAFNLLQTQLQMGQVTEEQGQLILGSLQSAFPDADFLDASAVAVTRFSSVLGKALAGDREAALGLGETILAVPESLTEAEDAAEEYEQQSLEKYEAVKGLVDDYGASVVDAHDAVIAAQSGAADSAEDLEARAGLVYQNMRAEQAELAQHAAAKFDSISGAGGVLANELEGDFTEIVEGVLQVKTAVTTSADKVAADFSRMGPSTEVIGKQRQFLGAIEDTITRVQGQTKTAEELQRAAESSGDAQAQAAADAARAAEDAAGDQDAAFQDVRRALEETTDTADDYIAVLEDVPTKVETDIRVRGITDARRQLRDLKADIRDASGFTITVKGEYKGRGGARPAGSIALEGWIRDAVSYAEHNPVEVLGRMSDSSDDLLLPGDDGRLRWTSLVEEMAAAAAEADRQLAVLGGRFAALTSTMEESPGVFTTGSLAWFFQHLAEQGGETLFAGLFGGDLEAVFDNITAALNLPPEAQDLRSFLEWLTTLAPERAVQEWESVAEALVDAEKRRHQAVMDGLKAELDSLDETKIAEIALLEDRIQNEEDRYDRFMRHMERQRDTIDSVYDDWRDAEKKLADLRRDLEREVRDAQKERESIEKEIHDGIRQQIDDEALRRKRAHEDALQQLEDRKDGEADRHDAVMRAIDEEDRRASKALDDLEDQLRDAKLAAEGVAGGFDAIKEALGELDDSSRRVRLGGAAAAQLREALASGQISGRADRRLAEIALAGGEVSSRQLKRLLEGVVDQGQEVLDQQQAEIAQLERRVALERAAYDEFKERLDERRRAEDDRHDAATRAIEDEKDARSRAFDAWERRLEDVKAAEDRRHDARMRAIREEFALELARLGLADATADDLAKRFAQRAAAIAAEVTRLFAELGLGVPAPGRGGGTRLGVAGGGGDVSGTTTGKVPPGLAKTHTLLTTISKGIERLVLIEQEGLRAERIQARAAREERVPNYAGTGADAYRFARGYLAPPGSLAGGRLEVPGHLGGPGLAGGPLPFPPGLGNFAPLPIAPPSAGPVLPSPTGAGGSQDHTLINYGTINVDLEDDEEAGGLVLDVLGVGSRGLRP